MTKWGRSWLVGRVGRSRSRRRRRASRLPKRLLKLERGWLKETLDKCSRDVAELPGWVFGGVNPYAPPSQAEPKKEEN
ncbi:hypothetical protein A2V54_00240 [candidate division WWE3 bacterium RBG_19FT_COMBO_53_11]|uniref:Uncharacterized protein n=1 Tax=candidate division WWE3 bacterium RBG_19FT_COMBO_53_11 TaxID=1802613 RepID=A0A1F4UHM1_UNCKA|nr:MAG: hypothetical protein A2155_01000 [candidate division WWE3 bacterium RBG_16_52_45]OGC44436.1 MAG: hypothetical protein A2V54_00240 [candidate division WWE3 bacterium RBG_19FT_COMBO_53_11]